ncbi:MAG TPA: SDR family oxidoreductase [Nocardioidaceae bacterium]|nr:SDR family oxidoreductase [Nocardioidaceae bacterium]
MSRPTVLVIGAGPGVSGFLAKRWAAEGYDVALLGLDEEVLKTLAEEIEPLGVDVGWATADITDEESLSAAIKRFGDHTERIDVLHFNPSKYRAADVLSLTPAQLHEDLHLGASALLTALQAARPYMPAGARVTATGSMAADEPDPNAPSLGVQKAALRNLIRSIDATLKDEGIRAVSVTVRGALSREGAFTAENVADALYEAATHDEADWQTEVPYSG